MTDTEAVVRRQLEFGQRQCSMEERLVHAAQRMSSADTAELDLSRHVLRRDQFGVFLDFARFLKDSADPALRGQLAPTGRIILPPRTGKTVIAGQIIAASGMMSVFIVPTKTLVEQTARALREQLVGIHVGTYYGESKDLAMWGVNVTTYQILQSCFREQGHLPPQIKHASLIFADEGHRSMTDARQNLLANAFDPLAVRVALTATPNYNKKRRLAAFYRTLIHEITISEAIELEMVAPVRVWIAAVDVDASRVTMKAGDYDEKRLGKLMRAAPFFEAARRFRYDPMQEGKSALICCVSQQQALTLHAYWCKKLPKGKPAPGIILGTTTKAQRETLLAQYEAGEIDTLINVGVLIEGWNSPRCKLVIDLAPSCSWVRATQKFFRPMTRWEDREASIFMLVPKHLPVQPVIPMDLFEWNALAFEQGALIASKKEIEASTKRVVRWAGLDHLKKVIARTDVIFDVTFEKPKLDITKDNQVKKVLLSASEIQYENVPTFSRFRQVIFRHRLFTGRGENLLRFCGIPLSAPDYLCFMTRFFPEAASDRYCHTGRYNETGKPVDEPFTEESFVSLDELQEVAQSEHDVFGRLTNEADLADVLPQLRRPATFVEEVDDAVWQDQLRVMILKLMTTLPSRERETVMRRFGLREDAYGEEATFNELASLFGISKNRAQQVTSNGIYKLGEADRQYRLTSFREPLRPKAETVQCINGEYYKVRYYDNDSIYSAVTIQRRIDDLPLVRVNEGYYVYRDAKRAHRAEAYVAEEVRKIEELYRHTLLFGE